MKFLNFDMIVNKKQWKLYKQICIYTSTRFKYNYNRKYRLFKD